jgi:hypothetical protein
MGACVICAQLYRAQGEQCKQGCERTLFELRALSLISVLQLRLADLSVSTVLPELVFG